MEDPCKEKGPNLHSKGVFLIWSVNPEMVKHARIGTQISNGTLSFLQATLASQIVIKLQRVVLNELLECLVPLCVVVSQSGHCTTIMFSQSIFYNP